MNAYRDEEDITRLLHAERSPSMEHVFDLVTHVAQGNAAVLLRGERGTGAEDLARAIHALSSRAARPFVKVRWAEVTEAFVESELFGTPAPAGARRGRLEEAEGGTLFIDEVGDFSLATQAKLMRCIRERAFIRSGTGQPVALDVRIIAASAQDLDRLIEEGRFLRDFCDELSVFSIRIPPLRERKSDILHLAQHLIGKHAKATGKAARRLSARTTALLLDYSWPGNLSELEHCIEHAVLLSSESVIDVSHLPPALQSVEFEAPETEDSLPAMLESVERTLIVDALRTAKGNRSRAAQSLGITERLMGLRVKKYGIEPKAYRGGNGV